jgi:hypothetical protein
MRELSVLERVLSLPRYGWHDLVFPEGGGLSRERGLKPDVVRLVNTGDWHPGYFGVSWPDVAADLSRLLLDPRALHHRLGDFFAATPADCIKVPASATRSRFTYSWR